MTTRQDIDDEKAVRPPDNLPKTKRENYPLVGGRQDRSQEDDAVLSLYDSDFAASADAY